MIGPGGWMLHAALSAKSRRCSIQTLRAMTTPAAAQSSALAQRPNANAPRCLRRVVNRSSGTIANGSCRLSTTWLKTSSEFAPALPNQAVTTTRRNDRDAAREQRPRRRRDADVEKAFHDDLAGERSGHRRAQPGADQRDAEQGAGDADAEQRREQPVGVGEPFDRLGARPMERAAGEDHDGGVDQQGEAERQRRVDRREADRFALARIGAPVAARLHDRRVQVEVVRHHRRADDADGEVEHRGVGDDARLRHEAGEHGRDLRLQPRDLEREADADGRDEGDDRGLEPAKAAALQGQQQHDVERA